MVNAIGAKSRDPINTAEIGRRHRWKLSRKVNGRRGAREEAPDSAWVWTMNGPMRDGTAELVSRNQIIRRERGQGEHCFIFPLELT